ncbi:MAG: hypothetical protein QP758_09305 [Actinotignum timonense]|uniref:hypothetical protein n=1 Tax=Actinotignum timonense TaxID=1870995 RepID=UPI00254B578E|nr:hypothetical protein [Actinotignum timonense]MDK8284667.1 hypothetical protein [Actinotignum timonense]
MQLKKIVAGATFGVMLAAGGGVAYAAPAAPDAPQVTAADTTAAQKALDEAKAKLAEFPSAEELQTQLDDQKKYVEIQKGTLSYAEEKLDASPGVVPAEEAHAKAVAELKEAQKAFDANPTDEAATKAKVDAAAAAIKAASDEFEKLEIAVSNAKAKLTELEVGVVTLNDKIAARAAAEKAVADAQKALDALKGEAPKPEQPKVDPKKDGDKVDPKADPKAEPKKDGDKKDADKKADPKAEKKADPKKEAKKAEGKKLANSGVDAGAAAGGAALLLLAGGAFVAYRKFA